MDLETVQPQRPPEMRTKLQLDLTAGHMRFAGMLPRMLIGNRIRRREDIGALQLAEADRHARARGALDAGRPMRLSMIAAAAAVVVGAHRFQVCSDL